MRGVIYPRYSSDKQTEQSIDGQIRECKEYAEKHGITIVNTYIDRAMTAKTDKRPEFQRMMKDSEKGLFDVIIVWKLDRFARNRYDSATYKVRLRKFGVKVVSATENIANSPEGILLESMLEGQAEYFSANLSQNVNRGMTENVLNAKFNGGALTYGYLIDENKHFQPDPVKAPIVTEIFHRYASGESTKSILSDLNEQGLKTSKGKAPGYSFVTNILKNRRYLGEYRYQDTVVENAFTPLVSVEIFDKCQRRLAENQQRPASFKPVKDKYLLTGKIFCGYCNDTMAGESGKSSTGTMHRYYHCKTAKKHKTCEKKRILKDFIENAVIYIARQIFDNKPLINQITDNCYELQIGENVNIPNLESQLKQAQKEIDNVMNAIKQGIITPTTKSTLEKLEQEKESLVISITREQITRPIWTKNQIKLWLTNFKSIDIQDVGNKQRLINVFVNSVVVYNDKIVIVFNYKDGEKVVTFDEIKRMLEKLDKKENADNHKDCQRSPLSFFGDP